MPDAERSVLRFHLVVAPGRPPLSPFLGAVNSTPWRGLPAGTCRIAGLQPSRLLQDVVYVEVAYQHAGWQNEQGTAYPADFNRLDLGRLVAEEPAGRAA